MAATTQLDLTRDAPYASPDRAAEHLSKASRQLRLRWTVDSRQPPDWESCLIELEAGFFAARASLEITAPGTTPIFCKLRSDGVLFGVALGAVTGCRLSRRKRHYQFASAPVMRDRLNPDAAVAELLRVLGARGAAEVSFGSFDSPLRGYAVPGATPGRRRQEFSVPLDCGEGAILERCSSTHRRHIRRGIKEGWSLSPLGVEAAASVLHEVQAAAIDRAAERGDGRVLLSRESLRFPADTPSLAQWGMRAFAAHGAEGLLAAALVGWGGRRAYYLIGGSTPYGYARSAAAWIHWSLMEKFRDLGYLGYNLGGAPLSACDPSDPAHGLFRFKSGFGVPAMECQGSTWPLRALHLKKDALLQQLSGLFQEESAA